MTRLNAVRFYQLGLLHGEILRAKELASELNRLPGVVLSPVVLLLANASDEMLAAVNKAAAADEAREDQRPG